MAAAPKQHLALELLALGVSTTCERRNTCENVGVRIIMRKKKSTIHIVMSNLLAALVTAAVGTLDHGAARSKTLVPVAQATTRER